MSFLKLCIFSFGLVLSNQISGQVQLIKKGHSHNDYTRTVPLHEALERGFTSIEIDVFSYRGKIRVSHYKRKLKKKPNLRNLYLQDLKKIIRENNGTVFKNDSTQLVLMIDLKKEKNQLYYLLKQEFREFEELIEYQVDGKKKWGPLKLVLSGNPPMDSILNDEKKYFTADVHFPGWDNPIDANLAPRASTNYNHHFKWKGKGSMPNSELQKLRTMIELAHQHHRKIRFWASPDNEAVWKVLLENGVDWINVDDLEGFQKFYLNTLKEN